MDSPLTRHSRLVFWLKIIMPILALAILSTLFLFARHIEFDGNLPFAEVDLDELANDPRLTDPKFSTMTGDGSAVKVTAGIARPGPNADDPVTVEDVVALYETASGTRIGVQADDGVYDAAAARLTLTGDVLLTTSDGYRLTAAEMLSRLDTTEISADGPVITVAPFGRLESGAMLLTGPESAHRLVFNKGVRLLYKPKN